MKPLYALLILFFLFISTTLSAQFSTLPPSSEKNKISLDLLNGLWGRLPLSSEIGIVYHRNITPRIEWNTKLAYSGLNFFLKRIDLNAGGELQDSVGGNGISTGTALQYFLRPPNRNSWFVGLEGNYTYTHFFNKNDRGEFFNLSKLSTSLIIGYRLHFPDSNIELDIFIGAGAAFRNYDWEKSNSRQSNNGANGAVVNAGWGFSVGLKLEPSTALATPMGLRLGFRF